MSDNTSEENLHSGSTSASPGREVLTRAMELTGNSGNTNLTQPFFGGLLSKEEKIRSLGGSIGFKLCGVEGDPSFGGVDGNAVFRRECGVAEVGNQGFFGKRGTGFGGDELADTLNLDPVTVGEVVDNVGSGSGNLGSPSQGMIPELEKQRQTDGSGAGTSDGGISSAKAGNLVVDLNSCPVEEIEEQENGNNENQVGFVVSDMVWGKVRSHPWWPGQIFDPWDASEKARKHFKPDTYMVAYFGDQSFAWVEELKLKPFWPHFSEMEKQSNSEGFRHAVERALEEAARRVEYGLSCGCIGEDAYDKIKTQVFLNPGVREQARGRVGGERSLAALSFDPVNLVHYVKNLARSSNNEVDRLELVTARAQLSAFNKSKGRYTMAEFSVSNELLENEADAAVLEENRDIAEVVRDGTSALESCTSLPSGKGTDADPCRVHKKHSTVIKKRSLADLMVVKESDLDNGNRETERKRGKKAPSGSAMKKRKAVHSLYKDSPKKGKNCASEETTADIASAITNGSWGVRGRSRRTVRRKVNRQFPFSNAVKESEREGTVRPAECSSSNEMLSELHLAAKNPLERYTFSSSMLGYSSDFRSFVQPSGKHVGSVRKVSDLKRKKVDGNDISETSAFKGIEDSYWTDRLISVPEQPAFLEKDKKPDLSAAALLEKASEGDNETGSTGVDLKEKKYSPTAFILNFSDADSIPSESELNKIFSSFGSLLESETEVLRKRKRAKVVFEKVKDAETAFSSSGKYGTFGPSLFRYTLDYSPILGKSSSTKSPVK